MSPLHKYNASQAGLITREVYLFCWARVRKTTENHAVKVEYEFGPINSLYQYVCMSLLVSVGERKRESGERA